MDGYVRKLLGEFEEEALDLFGFCMAGEPAYCVGKDCRIDLFAVAGDHCMIQFVDEAHGEECASIDDSRLTSLLFAQIFELFGQISACSDVAEDDVACVAEEQVVEV